MKRDLDGRLILVEFEEGDWQPCGRVRLTATLPDDLEEQELSLHVYECEETANTVGVASVDLDLEHAELLLKHLEGWVKSRRRETRLSDTRGDQEKSE